MRQIIKQVISTMAQLNLLQAVNHALHTAMEADDSVMVMGEDVGHLAVYLELRQIYKKPLVKPGVSIHHWLSKG